RSVNENSVLSILLSASDTDGNNLSFEVDTLPAGASFIDHNNGSATFSWTPVTGQAGSYPLNFTVSDNGVPVATDSEAIIISVVGVVIDETAPVISLLGLNPVSLELGSTYVDAGAIAVDNIDGAIPVSVSNPVNVNLVGSYVIRYDATDAAGNRADQVTRMVNVIEVNGVPGSLQFSSPVYSVIEGNPGVSITVTRVNGDFGAVSVDYVDVAGGSAIAGSDYTAISGSLNFADGVTSQIFSIDLIDDAVYEGDETVNLLLNNVSGASLGAPFSATLTITDNEPIPSSGSLQFSSAAYNVNENDLTVSIVVSRTGGSYGTVGVDYASADGSAISGNDYTAASGRLSFADGEVSQVFTIDVIDDADYEGDETLSLMLSNPTGGAGLSSPSLAVLTISENDPVPPAGSLQFSAPVYSVSESSTTVSITVARVGGSSGVVGVDYASADSSATAGSDYMAVSGHLSFADGVVSQVFSVDIIDDVDYEDDESLNLSLSNPVGGAGLSAPGTSMIIIENNDSKPVAGNAGSGGGGGIDFITLVLLIGLYCRNLLIRKYGLAEELPH
ncbi:MAG: DUF5011 domain-containing protein, partial [Gammaproteobacteria bacterium]|nr:DUF5011 domain-containing protein [Gammaproteobacteria bacterium]